MDINQEVIPLSYKFHSLTNLYKGSTETNIKLEIYEYGPDALEVKLINTNYQMQWTALKKQFLYFILSFSAYVANFVLKSYHLAYIDTIFIIWLVPLLWRLSRLVEYEKFIFCYDFGLHLQIQKCMGQKNRFVAACNIHDIVINEVLEDLDFRYLLILRTKGKVFVNKPIIPIFTVFKPSYDCLCLVYKHLNKVMSINK
ncbi:uncharacterized protein LOC119605575 [Lucilia sericata]|uniref:uncharacterized protein LOC119605575 n=1 Tax=Lucilia sericata TaxID=13632 RepID=UPI0018A84759|nr:uncharacterized protein LOC119605575 [Lucilia sericata]